MSNMQLNIEEMEVLTNGIFGLSNENFKDKLSNISNEIMKLNTTNSRMLSAILPNIPNKKKYLEFVKSSLLEISTLLLEERSSSSSSQSYYDNEVTSVTTSDGSKSTTTTMTTTKKEKENFEGYMRCCKLVVFAYMNFFHDEKQEDDDVYFSKRVEKLCFSVIKLRYDVFIKTSFVGKEKEEEEEEVLMTIPHIPSIIIEYLYRFQSKKFEEFVRCGFIVFEDQYFHLFSSSSSSSINMNTSSTTKKMKKNCNNNPEEEENKEEKKKTIKFNNRIGILFRQLCLLSKTMDRIEQKEEEEEEEEQKKIVTIISPSSIKKKKSSSSSSSTKQKIIITSTTMNNMNNNNKKMEKKLEKLEEEEEKEFDIFEEDENSGELIPISEFDESPPSKEESVVQLFKSSSSSSKLKEEEEEEEEIKVIKKQQPQLLLLQEEIITTITTTKEEEDKEEEVKVIIKQEEFSPIQVKEIEDRIEKEFKIEEEKNRIRRRITLPSSSSSSSPKQKQQQKQEEKQQEKEEEDSDDFFDSPITTSEQLNRPLPPIFLELLLEDNDNDNNNKTIPALPQLPLGRPSPIKGRTTNQKKIIEEEEEEEEEDLIIEGISPTFSSTFERRSRKMKQKQSQVKKKQKEELKFRKLAVNSRTVLIQFFGFIEFSLEDIKKYFSVKLDDPIDDISFDGEQYYYIRFSKDESLVRARRIEDMCSVPLAVYSSLGGKGTPWEEKKNDPFDDDHNNNNSSQQQQIKKNEVVEESGRDRRELSGEIDEFTVYRSSPINNTHSSSSSPNRDRRDRDRDRDGNNNNNRSERNNNNNNNNRSEEQYQQNYRNNNNNQKRYSPPLNNNNNNSSSPYNNNNNNSRGGGRSGRGRYNNNNNNEYYGGGGGYDEDNSRRRRRGNYSPPNSSNYNNNNSRIRGRYSQSSSSPRRRGRGGGRNNYNYYNNKKSWSTSSSPNNNNNNNRRYDDPWDNKNNYNINNRRTRKEEEEEEKKKKDDNNIERRNQERKKSKEEEEERKPQQNLKKKEEENNNNNERRRKIPKPSSEQKQEQEVLEEQQNKKKNLYGFGRDNNNKKKKEQQQQQQQNKRRRSSSNPDFIDYERNTSLKIINNPTKNSNKNNVNNNKKKIYDEILRKGLEGNDPDLIIEEDEEEDVITSPGGTTTDMFSNPKLPLRFPREKRNNNHNNNSEKNDKNFQLHPTKILMTFKDPRVLNSISEKRIRGYALQAGEIKFFRRSRSSDNEFEITYSSPSSVSYASVELEDLEKQIHINRIEVVDVRRHIWDDINDLYSRKITISYFNDDGNLPSREEIKEWILTDSEVVENGKYSNIRIMWVDIQFSEKTGRYYAVVEFEKANGVRFAWKYRHGKILPFGGGIVSSVDLVKDHEQFFVSNMLRIKTNKFPKYIGNSKYRKYLDRFFRKEFGENTFNYMTKYQKGGGSGKSRRYRGIHCHFTFNSHQDMRKVLERLDCSVVDLFPFDRDNRGRKSYYLIDMYPKMMKKQGRGDRISPSKYCVVVTNDPFMGESDEENIAAAKLFFRRGCGGGVIIVNVFVYTKRPQPVRSRQYHHSDNVKKKVTIKVEFSAPEDAKLALRLDGEKYSETGRRVSVRPEFDR